MSTYTKRAVWSRALRGTLLGALSLLPAISGSPSLYAQYGPRNMTTIQYDNAHTGWNQDEVVLTIDNVKPATFGKQWATELDGQIFGVPLYVSGVVINGEARDVVYAVTQNNFIYALDAGTGDLVWPERYSLGTPALSANLQCANISPNVGITSAPVIDLATGTLYAVGLVCQDTPCQAGSTQIYQITAVDIATGKARPGWPRTIDPVDNPRIETRVTLQRGALLLANNRVYVPFGGNACDGGDYYGWVVGVDTRDPNAPMIHFRSPSDDTYRGAAVWAYGGMAADTAGNLYIPTGNSIPLRQPGILYSNAVLRLSRDLTFSGDPKDFFTPSNWEELNITDRDLGSSTPTLLLPQEGSNTPNLIFIAGKFGVGHLINRDNLGGVGTGDGVSGEGIYSSLVFDSTFNSISSNAVYYEDPDRGPMLFQAGRGTQPAECDVNTGVVALQLDLDEQGNSSYHSLWCVQSFGAMTPLVTSARGQTGILWMVDRFQGVLSAYNAATGDLLYDTTMVDGDQLGQTQNFLHFTVIDGKVFVANRANNMVAYGLH